MMAFQFVFWVSFISIPDGKLRNEVNKTTTTTSKSPSLSIFPAGLLFSIRLQNRNPSPDWRKWCGSPIFSDPIFYLFFFVVCSLSVVSFFLLLLLFTFYFLLRSALQRSLHPLGTYSVPRCVYLLFWLTSWRNLFLCFFFFPPVDWVTGSQVQRRLLLKRPQPDGARRCACYYTVRVLQILTPSTWWLPFSLLTLQHVFHFSIIILLALG